MWGGLQPEGHSHRHPQHIIQNTEVSCPNSHWQQDQGYFSAFLHLYPVHMAQYMSTSSQRLCLSTHTNNCTQQEGGSSKQKGPTTHARKHVRVWLVSSFYLPRGEALTPPTEAVHHYVAGYLKQAMDADTHCNHPLDPLVLVSKYSYQYVYTVYCSAWQPPRHGKRVWYGQGHNHVYYYVVPTGETTNIR